MRVTRTSERTSYHTRSHMAFQPSLHARAHAVMLAVASTGTLRCAGFVGGAGAGGGGGLRGSCTDSSGSSSTSRTASSSLMDSVGRSATPTAFTRSRSRAMD